MKKVAGLIILFLIVCSSAGWGIIPHEIDFQGRLQIAGSPPPAGSHTLSVFMVNASGTIIWPSVAALAAPMDLAVTTDDRGIFSLKIPLPDNLPFDEPYSLKIAQIDGTRIPATDLIQSFSAVPYAFNSKNVIDTSGTGKGKIDLATTLSPAIKGKSTMVNGVGVKGEGELYGVEGYSKGDGVYGKTSATDGQKAGVVGEVSGSGVYGVAAWNSLGTALWARTDAGEGRAVWGINVAPATSAGDLIAILGDSYNGVGVFGIGGQAGVAGVPKENRGAGIYGESTFSGAVAVSGRNTGASGAGEMIGVKGESTNGYGVYGLSTGPDGYGVFGQGGKYAGFFNGDVQVAGTLTGNGRIKIAASSGAGTVAFPVNSAVGNVIISTPSESVVVYNSYLTSRSIILLTIQTGPALPIRIARIRPDENYFIIGVERGSPVVGGNLEVGYLIIN